MTDKVKAKNISLLDKLHLKTTITSKQFVFALTVFTSAFLLFGVQPLAAKRLLPLFGGTPAVWSTSMLFFQLLLLGGYTYTHFLAKCSSSIQKKIHLLVLFLSCASLVITAFLSDNIIVPGASMIMDSISTPTLGVLILLTISVGLPFFALSASGTLLQSWFFKSFPDTSPYRLYALSNAGSLIALLSYPFIFEPSFALKTQILGWSAFFVLFFILVCVCALLKTFQISLISIEKKHHEAIEISKPSIKNYIPWLLLSACASSLLISTTNQMSQEIAVVPFLWILPLALYLLSFILCFDRPLWYSRTAWVTVFCFSITAISYILFKGHGTNIIFQIIVYCLSVLAGCMLCHGELFQRRPHPKYLTDFYLTIAVGGAAGGAFISIFASGAFNTYWEYPISLAGCLAAVSVILLQYKKTTFSTPTQVWIPRIVAIMLLMISFPIFYTFWLTTKDAIYLKRTFYGVLKVTDFYEGDSDHNRVLYHGQTVHGLQYTQEPLIDTPTTYYHEGSAVGMSIEMLRAIAKEKNPPQSLRIGVVGLGVGTIAAYGKKGDIIRFYEINPGVIKLAKSEENLFSYLKRSKAQVDVVLGDARLSLIKELEKNQPQDYDLLVIDAFSSGSIPIHLLTLESIEIYMEHLKNPGGILALHISNHYLNLEPVVRTLAHELNLAVMNYSDGGSTVGYSSNYMLVAHHEEDLVLPRQIDEQPYQFNPRHLWTDDYSNLTSVLIRK